MAIIFSNGFLISSPPSSLVTSGLQFNFQTAPTSGTTWTDATGNGYNATLQGTTSYTGSFGGGVKINNTTYNGTGYISVPYNISSNTVTVEVVASFQPTSFWATIWGNEIWNTGAGYLANLTNTTVLNYGRSTSLATKTITATNSIRHWMFVISGTTQRLYINGAQLGTADTVTAQTLFTTNTFYFGSRHTNAGTGTADKMNSNIAANLPVYYQMRLYNRALSASEVSQNYNAVRGTYGI